MGARITNVVIKDCDITGQRRVGGLVGWTLGNCSVENCSVTGTVNGTDYVGGLAGMMATSSTKNCYTECTVSGDDRVGGLAGSLSGSTENCYATGTVNGTDYVGGLAGRLSGNTENCYATGTVTGGGDSVGGLAGMLSGSTKNCYATGAVGGGDRVGGLAGELSGGSIESSYATGTVTGSGDAGGLVGMSSYTCTIAGTVALNPSVSGTSAANRVYNLDAINSDSTVENSYAYSSMTVNGITVTSDDATGLHGADLKTSSGNFPADFWTKLGFTAANGWTVPTVAGELPYLTGMPKRPELTAAQKAETHNYEVTILGGGDGATADGEQELYTTVSLNAGTRSGCVFAGWTVESGGVTLADASSQSTSFTMSDKAVTIKAN